MALAVVQLLEPVEVADHQRERVAVAAGPVDLGLQLADERAPVQQAGEWVMVGQEAQLVHASGQGQCRRGLIGEEPQGLQSPGRGKQPIEGVVDPDPPGQAAVAV